MKRLICTLACAAAANAFAWGADGHSVIAEIAQRRLTPEAKLEMERLLGPGVSLASLSSWADDIRPDRPETSNWHFINFPVKEDRYDLAVVCRDSGQGDCIVGAMQRQRATLTCPSGDVKRREALKWAVHLIGDLHQPLHTITEERGGNLIRVDVEIKNGKCPRCTPRRTQENLHAVWDSVLISNKEWNWGAYVTRLEEGWLKSPEAQGAAAGSVEDWMLASHRVAAQAWDWLPADKFIGDEYFTKVMPLIDRQLALGGLRLARFLNETLPTLLRRESCN